MRLASRWLYSEQKVELPLLSAPFTGRDSSKACCCLKQPNLPEGQKGKSYGGVIGRYSVRNVASTPSQDEVGARSPLVS